MIYLFIRVTLDGDEREIHEECYYSSSGHKLMEEHCTSVNGERVVVDKIYPESFERRQQRFARISRLWDGGRIRLVASVSMPYVFC